jgi:hypothetical protein
MEESNYRKIGPWIEPAHTAVLEFRDVLLALYRQIREGFQAQVDTAFDKASRDIGYLVTTTVPVQVVIGRGGRIKDVELGAAHLQGTVYEKRLSPVLKKMTGLDLKDAKAAPGEYMIQMIWFDALKLRLRTDWIEPAHFRDYQRLHERFRDILKFDWIEPAHVVLGGSGQIAVNPDVIEPAHFKPSTDPWREKVLVAVIDEVYPELRLIERMAKLKDYLRLKVRPDVIEPAHFHDLRRRLPDEALKEIEGVLRRFGY